MKEGGAQGELLPIHPCTAKLRPGSQNMLTIFANKQVSARSRHKNRRWHWRKPDAHPRLAYQFQGLTPTDSLRVWPSRTCLLAQLEASLHLRTHAGMHQPTRLALSNKAQQRPCRCADMQLPMYKKRELGCQPFVRASIQPSV
jgi:hypothetical protein